MKKPEKGEIDYFDDSEGHHVIYEVRAMEEAMKLSEERKEKAG